MAMHVTMRGVYTHAKPSFFKYDLLKKGGIQKLIFAYTEALLFVGKVSHVSLRTGNPLLQ